MLLRGGIGREIWGCAFVRFDEPNLAAPKIRQKRSYRYPRDLASPDDLGVINVRAVVDPLLVGVVLRRIADDDEVLARHGIQLVNDSTASIHVQN